MLPNAHKIDHFKNLFVPKLMILNTHVFCHVQHAIQIVFTDMTLINRFV